MIISRRIRRLMAYIYMPLIFTILGYVLVYIAFKPIINIGVSITSMIMAQEIPDFTLDLESIYVEPQDMEHTRVGTRRVSVCQRALRKRGWQTVLPRDTVLRSRRKRNTRACARDRHGACHVLRRLSSGSVNAH